MACRPGRVCGERGLWVAAAAQGLRTVLSDRPSSGGGDFQAGYFVISKKID